MLDSHHIVLEFYLNIRPSNVLLHKIVLGNYLLSYKKQIDIIGEINANIWNNKKSIQLNIKDLIL